MKTAHFEAMPRRRPHRDSGVATADPLSTRVQLDRPHCQRDLSDFRVRAVLWSAASEGALPLQFESRGSPRPALANAAGTLRRSPVSPPGEARGGIDNSSRQLIVDGRPDTTGSGVHERVVAWRSLTVSAPPARGAVCTRGESDGGTDPDDRPHRRDAGLQALQGASLGGLASRSTSQIVRETPAGHAQRVPARSTT